MLLLVDKSEQSAAPEIIKQLQKTYTNVIVTNLPHRKHGNTNVTSGDVNIVLEDGSILAIERKTPHDFLQSIGNGHIFDQVEVMSNNAKYCAVVVTGYFTYTRVSDMVVIDGIHAEETNWRGASVRSAIRVLQCSGCIVEFCPDDRYAQIISEIYGSVNKGDARQSVRKQRIITFPPVDERVEFLAQLPGVGLKLADSLMRFTAMMDGIDEKIDDYGAVARALHYVSIMGTFNKKVRPKGWGPEKILTVRKFLGLSSDEYLTTAKEITVILGEQKVPITYTVIENTKYQKAKESE